MSIQTSQILPKEDSETLTKSVYDQYDKLHSVIYYDKESKVEKIVKVKVDPIGRVKESKTLKQIKVDVLKPAEAGLTSITFQGSILDAGTLPVTRVGFRYWRDINDPGFAIGGDDVGTNTSLDSGKFEQTVTGLEKDTTYYYRAYATNEYGTNYSRIYSVTTQSDPNLVIAGTTTGTAPFTVSLSANDDEETPTSYAWNLTGGNTPQFTTQVVNYTYTTAGTYTVNLTGFYSGGVTAIRTTTVQANADDTSIVGQWASVQSADYYNNVIGAYDMRNVPNINLANGLLDFWKLDDTSGNNTLTNTGNVQFVPGKIGNCAEFNNNAKALYVLSPDITPITLKSWSFWIYPTSLQNPTGEGPYQAIITNLKAGYWITFNGYGGSQKVSLFLNPIGFVASETLLPVNQWTHVAIVYDRPNVSIYINGVLDNTGAPAGSLQSIPQYSNIVLGAAQPGQYPFVGNIDAVGIWNRALLEQEIQTLYNSGNGTEDLRVVNAIVGPNLEAVNTSLSSYEGTPVGTVFNGDGSYLFSNATIPVTYPHTLVFVGRVNVSGAANETILINTQKTKWSITTNEMVTIFGRPSQLNAYNGSDNQSMGYVPNGSEWFYVAASFLANNTVRYQIRSKTQNRNGTLGANASKLNFNGFIGFGAAFNSATNFGFVGNVRLGMFINQEFTTEGAMTTLFESVTAGPANGLLV